MCGAIQALVPRIKIAPPNQLTVLPLDGSIETLDRDDYIGAAWSPTPRALAIMRAHGIAVPEVPDFDIIRRVNHREFALGLVPGLAVERFVRSTSELDFVITSNSNVTQWILKRPYGFSGRWRRIIQEPLEPADKTWIEASWNGYGGGVLIEPLVDIICDFVLHGDISRDGTIRFGRAVVQHCDEHGAWQKNTEASTTDLPTEDLHALENAGHISANALVKAGYWGPFGIDAYRWRDANGELQFRALGEINARYTMGWWQANL